MAAPTKITVAADIKKYVESQGNQVGLEGLASILNDMLTLIPDEE